MTISLEDIKKMKLGGIRKTVPMKPIQKDLKGINFPISALVDKEIIIVDWLYLDKGSTINPEKKCVKFQFYLGDMSGVCLRRRMISFLHWIHIFTHAATRSCRL